jgi:hypothetical protein
MVSSPYEITITDERLTFRTSSFKAEKTSVLHGGVYTKEFSSMLLASAVCIGVYMILDALHARSLFLRSLVLLSVFILSFLFAGKYVFKDHSLEAVFDRKNSVVHLSRSGLLLSRTEKIPFSAIASVEAGHRQFEPVNTDGIDFVQKISAQHGSAVPELSEVEEFVTVQLRLKDGSRQILYSARLKSGTVDGEPALPLRELQTFLGLGSNNA